MVRLHSKSLSILVFFIPLSLLFLWSVRSHIFASASINLDPHFGTGGIVISNGAAGGVGHDYGYSVIKDGNGKYVVTGASTPANGYLDASIWRFNVDGTPDTSFDGDGYVSKDNPGLAPSAQYDQAVVTKIESDGRLVVAGYGRTPTDVDDIIVWRFNNNGSLDTTFGSGNGFVMHGNAGGINSSERASDLEIQSDGKYVVAGYGYSTVGVDMIVWRFNNNGSLDTSFGGGSGFVKFNNSAGGNGSDVATDMVILNDGKLFLVGYSSGPTATLDLTFWKLNADGSPDTSYDSDGIFSIDGACGVSGSDLATEVIADSSGGMIVAGGCLNINTYSDLAIWKLDSSGNFDQSFNNNTGFAAFNGPAGLGDSAQSVVEDSNGKYLVTGTTYLSGTDGNLVVVRFNSDGTLDTTLNGTGYVTYADIAGLPGGTDIGYSLITDSNGKFIVAGYSRNLSNNYDMFVMSILDFPHTIISSLSDTENNTISGSVSAPDSTTTISSVSFSLDLSGDSWVECSALDGSFDSLEENFTCSLPNLEPGQYTIFIRACNEFGACSYQENYAQVLLIEEAPAILIQTGDSLTNFYFAIGVMILCFFVLSRSHLAAFLRRRV